MYKSVWLNTLGELVYTVYMITLVICDRIGVMCNGEIKNSI